ncbi:MAG TPA: HEAT repeat domain-containing protein, partial [Tepidisphaeraceae bacterium]|nr:HEAT repeat domain-containing protein [Tepidisphaeraceae bacterium]
FLPPIADMGAGPSGLAYYPGTGFSHAYDHHFFECDFRGSPNGSVVHTYTMDPQGAGFKMGDLHNFVSNLLSTDFVFGPAGGAYIADWVDGWNPVGVGRIYHVTDPAAMKEPVVKQVQDMLAEGFEKRSNQELCDLLSHRDQRIRQEAQFELADRGSSVAGMLADVANHAKAQLGRIHAIWALGQIAEKSPDVLKPLLPLLADQDAEIRAQAARVLGDHHDAEAFDTFVKMLQDPNLRVRYFAAMAIGKLGRPQAAGAIVDMIRQNADKDVYIRHAGLMALLGMKDWGTIESAAHDSSRSVRLASLLAMRRLQRPEIAMFLHDPDQQLVLEAARAINDLPITDALPQLASLLGSTSLQDYVTIRAINANYRVGTPQAAGTLAHFAADPAAPSRWRVAALEDLTDWATPGHRDRVTNLPRPLPDRDARVARDAVASSLTSILHDAPNSVRVAALKLIEKLGVTDTSVLMQLLSDTKVSAEVRSSAVNALAAQNDPKLGQAIDVALKDTDEHVRAAAIEAMAKLPNPTDRIASFIGKGTTLEQQAAFAALGATPGNQSDPILLAWMDRLLSHNVPPELELDVLEAARARQNPQLQAKVAQYEGSFSKSDPLAPYRVALEGGDPASGDKIFHLRSDASCLRCHTVHGTGGIVGPVLDGIGSKQSREYLLESMVNPNAKIAQGFESVIIKLKDGRTETGIVKSENERSVQLIDADGKRIRVRKSEIVARARGQSAMPEGLDKVLSKRDLRDLVAYMASLKN